MSIGGVKMLVENIKSLCVCRGISISALERKLNFGNSTISKWEKSSPSIENVSKVANYFGCTVDELLKSDDPTNKAGKGEENESKLRDNMCIQQKTPLPKMQRSCL